VNNLFKHINYFFRPRDFSGNSYAFLTNQFGHLMLSYWAATFTNFWWVCGFWLVWELRHLIQSKNAKDFCLDLFFECAGAAAALVLWWLVPAGLVLVFFTVKIYKQESKQII